MESSHILRPKNDGEELKIAEGLLRRRKVTDFKRRLKYREERRKIKKDLRKSDVTTLQSILKRTRNSILDRRRLKNKDKKPYMTPKKDNGRLIVIVVRNSRYCGSSNSYRILEKLRLLKKFSAIILSNDEETIKILRGIKPYVFYGFPNHALLKTLVYKKGAFINDTGNKGNNDENEILLTDNNVVEERLGNVGVLCTEDIVTGIWNGRDDEDNREIFDSILRNLAPFQLCDLKKTEGLDASKYEMGFLGKQINAKINSII
ncbi:hypothetical protein RS030_2328 [Cryptosporidium xiaoi]|uniref:60S ribosomal protein L7 n=1 Tax=Cryptosporidium xiaoi TaxID=659607 RepID=A0AAV9XW35_9CRYT